MKDQTQNHDYPPSILLIAENSSQTAQIERYLEHNGCQIDRVDANLDEWTAAPLKYFELIVFSCSRPPLSDCGYCEICPKLKANPYLANLPLVVLTHHRQVITTRESGLNCVIHYLPHKAPIEPLLWQIIQEVRYLTYRYM
ncbi:MAG: hypothetical protein U0401_15865 [Anaerolineae bacterium]